MQSGDLLVTQPDKAAPQKAATQKTCNTFITTFLHALVLSHGRRIGLVLIPCLRSCETRDPTFAADNRNEKKTSLRVFRGCENCL